MSWLREQCTLLGDFLGAEFRRTWRYCALGMVLAAGLGFLAAALRPEAASQIIENFMAQIQESGVIGEDGSLSVFALLFNNWRAMLTAAAYGAVPFLFLPVFSLLVNGALLGVMAAIYQANGMSMVLLAAGLLPHGIFELPALVLSIACGVTLCRNMGRMVVNRPDRTPLVELCGDLLRVMVLLVAPLTVAAAFVECYVTPLVMELFA